MDAARRVRARTRAPVLGLVALLLSACAASAARDGGGAPTALSSEAERGRVVFTEVAEPTCAQCHALGDADGVAGPALDGRDLPPDDVAAIVRAGRGLMPAYEEQLSDEQIDAVAAYVAEASAP